MTELGLAEHHAGEKGTECQRQSKTAGGPGRQQCHQQHRERKQLGGAPLGDQMEQRAQQPPADKEDECERGHGFDHRPAECAGQDTGTDRRAQDGDDHQEGNRHDVLKHGEGESEPAVRAVVFPLLGQLAADDGR